MARRLFLLTPLLINLLLAPGAALAHARLVSATPAVGATIATAPALLVLRFSEPIEPRFSTIAVRDAAGARVDRGAPRGGPEGSRSLAIDLAALPPGTYVVAWTALSVDTHRVEGSFRFTVAP